MSVPILSWNIWGGMFLPVVTGFLNHAKADIIALQEVEEQGEAENTARTIAEALGYSYIYARSMHYTVDGKDAYRGNAVLSKYPIVGNHVHTLSSEQSRTATQADIDIGGRTLHVLSVHLIHSHQQPSVLQEEQVTSLISKAPKDNTVIMGDFNSLPESRTIIKMRQVFRDTDPANTPSWCLYPDGCEVCKPEKIQWKLDYIFVSHDLKTGEFRVGDSKGSDHLPVSVSLEI